MLMYYVNSNTSLKNRKRKILEKQDQSPGNSMLSDENRGFTFFYQHKLWITLWKKMWITLWIFTRKTGEAEKSGNKHSYKLFIIKFSIIFEGKKI